MKYFTFQTQFHAPIRSGVKQSTIRPSKKLLPGEQFALRYWMFKPYRGPMGFLGTATCWKVERVTITADAMRVDGHPVPEDALAIQEGFASAAEMRAWFTLNHGGSFTGWIHVWTDFRATDGTAMPANAASPAGASAAPLRRPCWIPNLYPEE